MSEKDMNVRNEGCVLIVDDEEAVRDVFSRMLTASGFSVLTAGSYKSAVKVLDGGEEIDAVVCDLKMPGESGLEVLHYINEKEMAIPVLFLTAYATIETCQEALREGAFDYIMKPDNKDRIILSVKHAVEKTRMARKHKELQMEILRMAEEHAQLLEGLLADVDTKDKVQRRITEILDKWKQRIN
jgi:DNA-binding NtrC family response regulator